MNRLALLALFVPLWCLPVPAQESALPPGNRLPILRLQADGPTSAVTCLTFSPDGKTLYAGGYDKVVRTWRHDGKAFVLDRTQVYRVPLGPGTQGDINALAVSPDGKWLAVGGVGVSRDAAGFADVGIVLPRSGRVTEAMRRDQGLIYLFEREKPGNVRLLRGHRGSIRALVFAAGKDSPLLISAAREWNGKTYTGRVRVWEVEKGKELAAADLAELPDPQDRRPGLAAWREQGRLRLAVAWQDSALRVWEVGKSEKWEQAESGLLTDAVAHLSGDQVLVSSARGQAAHLGVWNVQAGPALAGDRQREKHVGTQPSIAIGLELASSRVGGEADLAALIVRIPNRDPSREEYSLVLASLKDFGQKQAEVRLWTGRPARQPVLAATPGGRQIAVAGNRDHEILVYSIEDLLAGKKNLAQPPLRSEGRARDQVAFVKNARNEPGLAFSDTSTSPQARGAAPREPVEGDLIFNLASNRLSDKIQGWKLDSPDLRQWQARLGDNITVEQNGRAVGKPFPLQRRQVVTQLAVLPPSTRKSPLLAVAYQELGQTNLVLVDVATGKDFRVLTGHVNPIRALAFSGDGRYLASAGDDQVVNVWSLLDLDQVIGKQGLLRGLVIKESEGKLAVAEIIDSQLNEANRDAIRKAGLQVDDTVAGLVSEGQLRALKSVASFYPAIWQSRPDSQVVLRTSRGDVTLTVDQGIDEHKPLFSLFVTRERQWIGWNPLGPYDVSDEKLESRVGWHRNTGLPAAPTSFGPVALHRQEYYRRGILRRLFERGDVRTAFFPREAGDEPTLTVWIDELGPKPAKVRNNRAIIQKAPVTLGAAIDNVPPERLGWIRWQFNDQDWQDFSRDLGKTRKADLSSLPWTRGEHSVQVVLRTHEVGAEEKTARINLLFLPEPPVVEFPARWLERFGNGEVKQATVRAAEFAVLALVRPGAPGEAVLAWLEHNGRKSETVNIARDAAPTEPNFKQTITLQPGRNEIVVIARNKGGLPGLEEYEEKRTLFVIHHAPVPLPRIVVESVAPAISGGDPPRQGQSVKVRDKEVQIRGTIAAETALTEITLDGQALSGFDREKGDKTFSFRVKRSLEPGKNTLKFAAKAKESKEAAQELVIEYEPALPEFTLTSPLDLEDRPADRREIRLQGRLAPLPAEKVAVQVLHGQREIPATYDARTGDLAASLTLDAGENALRVIVSVAGKKQTTTLRAYVRRPPRIVKDDLPAQAQKALVSFTAEVHSPGDLPLTDARLTGERLAERRLGKDSLKRTGGDKKETVWTVSVQEVPLAEGVENTLELWVKNADGEVRKTLKIQGPRKVLPRPVVTILDPRVDVAVDAEKYTLKFKVESASPLTRLAVVRDGQDIKAFPVGIKQAEHSLEVELGSGCNAFQVVAVNEGGETSVGRAVSRVPDTVTLRFEGLAPRGQVQPVQPIVRDGQVIFPRVPVGEVRLTGQVVWPIQRQELRVPVRIRLRVNGFDQPEVDLGQAQGLHRAFAANLKLNQAEDNIVELDFGPLKIDPATPPRFRVARCDAPLTDQRLHLIAIAAGDRDLDRVGKKILNIFGARDIRSDRVRDLAFQRFQADGFKECRLYGPLPSDVSKDEIYRTLRRVNELIRAERFPANEVVGVYFQGHALLQGEEYYLLTHESLVLKNHRRSALTVAGLRTGLDENLGAHLLLVDVVSPGGEDVPMDALCASCVGVFHYAWLKTEGVTEQDRLLEALGQAMSRGKVLREIHRQMEAQAKQTRQKLPALVPLNFVPQEMANLRLGR